MTIKMRLDTEGLRALIASNPQLELEIGKEVVNNITSDAVQSKVLAQIDLCLKGMVNGSGWSPTYTPKAPELRAAIEGVVNTLVKEVVGAKLDQIISERVNTSLANERVQQSRDFKAVLQALLTPEMARDILREKILL